MALKDIFTMVKADRYTADGREEVIKARNAEIEDARRTYKIGEISQATGLQKTATGWVKPKKGGAGKGSAESKPAGTTSRSQKEAVIRKELGLRGEKDLERFSDEQIEKMYQKTQQTPEQKKADFDKSKIGQVVNKGREEFAAEKTRQKELSKKTNAIGLPKAEGKSTETESKGSDIPDFKGMSSEDFDKKLRSEGWTTGGWEGSGTHASAIFKKGDRKIRVNEGQPGKITSIQEISKPSESKPAESERERRVEEYWKSIRKDKLSPVSRVAAELDRGTFDDDVRETMGDDQSMEDLARSLISPAFEEKGDIPQDKLDTARRFILKRYKTLESDATDAAPRVLTGDTKIRVRRETKDKTYTPESINGPREKLDI